VGTVVTRRKGEITRADIGREWPHRVELPDEAVRGKNCEPTWGLAKELGAAPYPLSDFHDDRHFSIFHFKTSADAEAFHAWFGGRLLPVVDKTPRGRRQK
jgi:hypothetical protein